MYPFVLPLLFSLFTLTSLSQAPVPFQDEQTLKYGYKDASGKIVIKPRFDVAYEFTDHKYAEVNIGRVYEDNIGGKWGIIDTKGKLVIPIVYDNVKCLGYNLFALNKGHKFSNMDASPSGKFAIFHASGKQLTPFIYSGFLLAVRFEEGYAPLETFNGIVQKYGLLDSTGKVALPVKYDRVGGFSEGYCKLELNGRHGFINKSAKLVIPLKYEYATAFSEGLAGVQHNGKWGFINAQDKFEIAPQYEEAKYFSEGFAPVKQGGKWGVIDKQNVKVVDFLYEDIVWVKNGATLLRVLKDGKYIEVDRAGNEVK